MKSWKIAIILIGLIGISTGAYFGISKSIEKKEAEEIVSSGAGMFLEFNSDDINEISFSSNEDTFEFTSEDGSTWICTNNDMRVNNTTITSAIYAMSALNTTKLIEENSSDLSKYGLDNPVTVSCSDGSNTYDIQIGNTSPSGESYYVKSLDNNDVYTITVSEGSAIHIGKNDLKSRFIIDTYVSDVQKIVYSSNDDIIFDCQKNSSGAWELVQPKISNVNVNISKISNIADLLIRADVIEFISENPTNEELKQYGLDNPKYTIEIAGSNANNTLYLGNSPEDNVIYAQFGDTKEVATFYIGELGILDSGTEIILNNVIYDDKQENITNIKINYQNKDIILDVSYNSDDRTYSYTKDGTKVTGDDYYSLIDTLVKSTLQIPLYNIQLDAKPTGDPDFSITYTRNYDPTIYTLDFIPTNKEATHYYVLMNGEYKGCTIRTRDLKADGYLISAIDDVNSYGKS